MNDPEALIKTLGLAPHPEGGFYCRTYESIESTTPSTVSQSDRPSRPTVTSIYYLLQQDHYSRLHRIQSEELWFYHTGSTDLQVCGIDEQGSAFDLKIGPHSGAWQTRVAPKAWFGARLVDPGQAQFALVSCVVTPGFVFSEFELADRHDLVEQYPEHRALIESMTSS